MKTIPTTRPARARVASRSALGQPAILAALAALCTSTLQAGETLPPGLYATIKTPMGEIVLQLLEDKAPLTVKNFTELAEGKREFKDPKTGFWAARPFYNGLTFHRVVKGFVIQGGDPLGDGRGGPGYKFDDEIKPDLKFDSKGLLAMANSGPGTNGSQFFITLGEAAHLNGKHTIFGKVVRGMETVEKIGAVPVRGETPTTPVTIESVTIQRVASEEPKTK